MSFLFGRYFSKLLLNLPLEKHKDLLRRYEHLDYLFFEESCFKVSS